MVGLAAFAIVLLSEQWMERTTADQVWAQAQAQAIVPNLAGFWVLGLGLLSSLLATLSVMTRKNSRHPLLMVGLAAFAIVLLSEQWMERTTADQVWAQAQAQAIVSGTGAPVMLPDPTMAPGAYLALGAATMIVLFGMTIVVRRVSTPYAVAEDDDV